MYVSEQRYLAVYPLASGAMRQRNPATATSRINNVVKIIFLHFIFNVKGKINPDHLYNRRIHKVQIFNLVSPLVEG